MQHQHASHCTFDPQLAEAATGIHVKMHTVKRIRVGQADLGMALVQIEEMHKQTVAFLSLLLTKADASIPGSNTNVLVTRIINGVVSNPSLQQLALRDDVIRKK